MENVYLPGDTLVISSDRKSRLIGYTVRRFPSHDADVVLYPVEWENSVASGVDIKCGVENLDDQSKKVNEWVQTSTTARTT